MENEQTPTKELELTETDRNLGITAADLLITPEPEETTPPVEEIKSESQEEKEFEFPEDDGIKYGDEDEYELPKFFDPELLEKNPELLKRTQDYEKGVKKLVSRLKEKESSFEAIRPEFETLSTWSQLLTNPDTAQQALQHLINETAKAHNFDPLDLYLNQVDNQVETPQQSYKPTQEEIDRLVEKRMNELLGPVKGDLENLKAQKAEKEKDTLLSQYVNKVFSKTAEVIKQSDNGWEITEDMLREAVTKLPHLANEPVKAVRQQFSDERVLHHQKATRSVEKAPTLISTKNAVGDNFPTDRTKLKAADILRMIRE